MFRRYNDSMKENTMKRIVLCTIILLSFLLTGCGEKDFNAREEPPDFYFNKYAEVINDNNIGLSVNNYQVEEFFDDKRIAFDFCYYNCGDKTPTFSIISTNNTISDVYYSIYIPDDCPDEIISELCKTVFLVHGASENDAEKNTKRIFNSYTGKGKSDIVEVGRRVVYLESDVLWKRLIIKDKERYYKNIEEMEKDEHTVIY